MVTLARESCTHASPRHAPPSTSLCPHPAQDGGQCWLLLAQAPQPGTLGRPGTNLLLMVVGTRVSGEAGVNLTKSFLGLYSPYPANPPEPPGEAVSFTCMLKPSVAGYKIPSLIVVSQTLHSLLF